MTTIGIDIHSLHLHNTSQAMIDAYEKVKHLDTAAVRVTEQPTSTIAFNSATDFPNDDQQPLRDFLQEYGHHNSFITCDINPVTHFVQWVSLYRADAAQVCTPEETELLACFAPHLMQALTINRLVHLDRLTGDTAREKWSVAIADNRGVLYHADRRFRELVEAEWPADDPEKLPRTLLDSLATEGSEVIGKTVVVRRSLERGLLFLKAREREPVDKLTEREFLVARLLVSGLSQKQVAAKLERSPETIRSQVKVIFDKLGINNVAMLGPLLQLRE